MPSVSVDAASTPAGVAEDEARRRSIARAARGRRIEHDPAAHATHDFGFVADRRRRRHRRGPIPFSMPVIATGALASEPIAICHTGASPAAFAAPSATTAPTCRRPAGESRPEQEAPLRQIVGEIAAAGGTHQIQSAQHRILGEDVELCPRCAARPAPAPPAARRSRHSVASRPVCAPWCSMRRESNAIATASGITAIRHVPRMRRERRISWRASCESQSMRSTSSRLSSGSRSRKRRVAGDGATDGEHGYRSEPYLHDIAQ